MKKINTKLSSQSIKETIRQLETIKKNLKDCEEEITKELVDKGVSLVKENYANTQERPFDEDYTVVSTIDGNKGKVIAQGSSVIYMEFGTGEIGKRGPTHNKRKDFPLKDFNSGKMVKNLTYENGEHYWIYGATYTKNTDGHWYEGGQETQGIPAGAQVYNASEKLKNGDAINIAKKVVDYKIW